MMREKKEKGGTQKIYIRRNTRARVFLGVLVTVALVF